VERPWWFLHGILAGLATLGVGEVVTGARAFAGVNGGGPLGVMHYDFGPMGVELTFLGVVVVAFGAGIGEELFFRGYLQTRLEARIPHWAANLMVGILFGVAHGELWHSTFALGAGLIFGFVARRTGTILASMTAHVINNAARVLQSSLAAGATASWYHDRGLANGALGFGLIVVGLGGVMALTRHRDLSNT
jgi:membrane protease YdiL (CAAX protease family)